LSMTLTAGTYSADGLAAAVQKAINGAILNHYGLSTGTEVVYHDNSAGGGGNIDGLTDGTSYYLIRTATNSIELASSLANAQAASPIALPLGPNLGAGIGQTLTPTLTTSTLTFGPSAVTSSITNNEIGFTKNSGLYAGEAVVYNTNGGTSIGGLTSGATYYVISVDATHIQLATSPDNAASGTAITLTSLGTGSFSVPAPTSNVTAYISGSSVTAGGKVIVQSGFSNPDTQVSSGTTASFNPANVTLTGNAISFANPHGFSSGQEVLYHSGGSAIGGLTNGQTYYVIVVNSTTIKLASTHADALAGTARSLTSTGGSGQSFTPLDAGNTKTFSSTAVTPTPATQPTVSVTPLDAGSQLGILSLLSIGPVVSITGGNGEAAMFGTPTVNVETITGSTVPNLTITSSNDTLNLSVNGVAFSVKVAHSTYANADALATAIQTAINNGLAALNNQITFAAPTSLTSGEEVVYHNGGSSNLSGLTDGKSYYVIFINSTTIKLASTYASSQAGTALPLGPGVGGANQSLTPLLTLSSVSFNSSTVSVNNSAADEITFTSNPGLATGTMVYYQNNGNTNVGGLANGGQYYVIQVDATHIRLASSLANANAGIPVSLTAAGTGTSQSLVTSLNVPPAASTLTINPATDVSVTDNAIHFTSADGFTTGEEVVYHSGGGSNIGGLTDGKTYYVIVADASTIKLAATYHDATATVPVPIALTSVGTSSSQTITPINASGREAFNPSTNVGKATSTITQLTGKQSLWNNADGGTFTITVTINNQAETTSAISYNDTSTLTTELNKLQGVSNVTVTGSGTRSDPWVITGLPTFTTNDSALTGDLQVGFASAHGFKTGDEVVYHNSGGTSVGNLHDGQTYFVIKISDAAIELASTYAKATATIPAPITLDGKVATGNGHTFTPTNPSAAQTFGTAAVSTTHSGADEITFATDPGLQTGDAVVYYNGGGTSIGGLINGQVYYAIRIDATHDQLALTPSKATNGDYIDLTSIGTGTNHSLVKKPTSVSIDGIVVPLPSAFGAQVVSVTAAGAGGDSVGGAGAVSLNFIRMNVQAYISNTGAGQVLAGSDVDVQANDTSKADSGTGALALSLNAGVAIDASVGLNDISNTVKAYIQGATVQSTGGSVTVSATETAQDVNVVIGGAGSNEGLAFGGSFAFNYITNTVAASIEASGTGSAAVASTVNALGNLSVVATDTASIATLAGNVAIAINTGKVAASVAFAINNVSDSVTATIDNSTATSATGNILVSATFARPAYLPAGLDVQIAAMAVDGSGAAVGAGAGSVALNWINNDVEAKIADISASENISAAGLLEVTASDHSTIDSLAGAVAIAGIGASAGSGAIGASIAYNYLGGDPNDPNTTNNNKVMAIIENCAGPITAGQVLVQAVYDGQINNITVAGAAAGTFALGGAVSINNIINRTEAHISGASNVTTTKGGSDSLDVTSQDTSTIQVLAGGVGIAIATETPVGIAAGVSVASNEIFDTNLAYIDSSSVHSAGDVSLTATSTPTIKALTIGVAIAGTAVEGGFAGSGAGAGSGNTVGNTVEAYISNSGTGTLGVYAGGAVNLTATDSPTILACAGALGVGVAIGGGGSVGASVGISVAINHIADTDEAYMHASTVQATGHNVTLTATETGLIEALSVGGAVGVGAGGGDGVGVGAAGAGSGNTIANFVYAYIAAGSLVTTLNGGNVVLMATDTSTITANAGGVGIGAAIGGANGTGVSFGVAASTTDIENNVKAYIDGSTVLSAGGVTLEASETATITTLTIGGAIGVGAGGLSSAGVAVAGSASVNTIKDHVLANVANSSTVHASGAALNLRATDGTTITASAGGVALGVGAGYLEGSATAVGFAAANNDIENTVEAYIDHSTATGFSNDVALAATETAVILAFSIGGAVAIGGGFLVGAAGAGAGGNSTNTLRNTVKSFVANRATVTTTGGGNVSLTTIDSANTTARTVAASVAIAGGLLGGAAIAIGAALAVNDVADTVEAYSSNSTITSAGSISLSASATSIVHAASVAASVSIAAASVGVALSGAGANSTNTVNNTIESYITGASPQGKSVVSATGDISLTTSQTCTIDSTIVAASLAGGLFGASIGVSVAENDDTSTIQSFVDNASVTSTAGGITLSATSNDTVTTLSVATSVAAALGGAGAGGTATVNVDPTLEAYAGSGATLNASTTITITATATNSGAATTYGTAAGAVAVGSSTSTATTSGSVKAHVDGVISGSQTVTIQASAKDTADAEATGLAGGIIAGAGAGATATVAPTIQAYTLGNITATTSLSITAALTPETIAKTIGVAVSYLYAVGASNSQAINDATIAAYVGTGSQLTGGTLSVSAQQLLPSGTTPSAYAFAAAGGGGTLVGANATYANASTSGSVAAYTGGSVKLPDGDVSISATSHTAQSAVAIGVSVGYVALGADTCTAGSSVTTAATLGAKVSTDKGRTGAISVLATGADQNTSAATAGAGGFYAGNAATGLTTDTSTVSAEITSGTLYAGDVTVNATNNALYAPSSNSLNASALGASGSTAKNDDTTSATATIGDNSTTTITATGKVIFEALNAFQETTSGESAQGAGGGVANAAAVLSLSTLNGTANLNVGDKVTISSGTDPVGNPGGIAMVAASAISAVDQVTLTTGGALAGAGVNSELDGTLHNTVTIGTGDNFTSKGNIGAGTYTTVNAQTNAYVSTFGLAVVGSAQATSNVTSTQAVNVGASTTMSAFGNVNLTAGNDPTGLFNTTMNGQATAQGYVRGLIAIPVASATAALTSNASLSIGTGDQINSGQNVTIGAFPGVPTSTANGTGHGYELGFIPATDGSSSQSSPTSSTVTQNGTITAGIYHELNITIPNDQSSGNFSSTITTNPDGSPYASYTSSFSPSFSAPNFVNAHYSGTDAQLLNTGISSDPVGAYTLGTLYASGGVVTVNAGTITGTGSITAYGGPTITVTNNSPDYLILGAIDIPDLPGGQVNFTGAASVTAARTAGITIAVVGANGNGGVTIHQNYNGSVGNPSNNDGPALLLTGPILNLGGVVNITNVSGSLGQGAAVYGQQVNVLVPKGVFVVQIPAPEAYYAGSDPYSQWQSYMIWPGGNPSSAAPSANTAIAYVANAIWNSAGQYTTAVALTKQIIGQAGNTADGYSNSSEVFYGDDVPWVGYQHDGSYNTAVTQSPISQAYAISGSAGGNDGYFPMIPVETLTKTAADFASASLTGSQNSSAIYGGQVSIHAQTIDINGGITAGQPTTWSANLPAALTSPIEWLFGIVGGIPIGGGPLSIYRYYYQHGLVGNPLFNIPLNTVASGDAQITATYNAQTNQITVDNVSASSGGGFVKLNGAIISTDTLGKIHVNGGLGQVTVNNQTGIPLLIQNIYTGNSAATAASISKVDITDTNLPATSNQTLYVYQPGQPIMVYTGADGATLGTGAPSSTIYSTSATYSPQSGMRWQWVESASLSRTVDLGTTSTVTNWTFNGDKNNPWQYIDPSTGQPFLDPVSGLNVPIGQIVNQTGLPVFQETITGSSSDGDAVLVYYHNGHYGFAPASPVQYESDGRSIDPWFYSYATDGYLTLTMSVKADNLIGIDFSGLAVASVSITSNAPVYLDGKITNPSGTTTISALGSIAATADASIVSKNLTLTATGGGIGNAGQLLAGALTSGGVLTATAGNQGVYLNLGSGALIGQVSAGSTLAGYGNVIIDATGDLQPESGLSAGTVNVTGNNITINSSAGAVGSQANPLDIAANGLDNTGLAGGVINVNALDDIGLVQDNGDLLIGSVVSTGGNVSVTASNGGIYDARGTTSAQALSEAQIQQVWSSLQLTASDGAADNANATVTAFQNQVDVNYLQYWQLISNGTVSNGTITLTATGLDIFRPRTAAALQIPFPTDAQIQTYANGVYQATLKFFDINFNQLYFQLLENGNVQNGVFALNASAASTFRAMAATALGITSPTDAQVEGWAASEYQTILADQNPDRSWMSSPDFETFNPHYQYVATTDQITALTQNSVWTEAELRYAVDSTGLGLSSGVPVGSADPNISGRTVVLSSHGSMGRLASAIDVTLADMQAGTLTDDQKAALVLATAPGDVTLLGVDAQGATVTFALGQQPSGVTLTGLRIKQTAPLFVAASLSISANTGKSVYLQSTNQDLPIDQIRTGRFANLTAPGNIKSAGTSSPQIVTGSDLTLLAGSGKVGTSPSSPLVVQIGGVLDAAVAGQDVYLQQVGGDLNFDRILAGGAVNLVVPSGGLYQQITNIPLIGQTLSFNVRDGVNGVGAPLEIQLSSPGTISGQAGKDININSIHGSLTVQTLISSGGNVTLASAHSILDGIDRTQGAVSPDISGQNISLTTGGTDGAIGSASDFLVIHLSSSPVGKLSATTNNNAYILEDTGDLTLSQISATFGEVDLNAPHGSILNGSTTTNLIAVKTYLVADQNVGTPAAPLSTSVAFIEGSAQAGTFDISNTGPAVVGGVTNNSTAVYAGSGTFIQTHSPLEIKKDIIAPTGDIRQAGNRSARGPNDLPSDLIVDAGVTIKAETGNVFLGGGDNVTIPADTMILAAKKVTIQSAYRMPGSTGPDPEPGVGTIITLAGTISATQVEVDGSVNADRINIDMSAPGSTLTGHTRVLGGGGGDIITINQLNGRSDSLDVDGGGGPATYIVNLRGGNTGNLINVFDSGTHGNSDPVQSFDASAVNGSTIQLASATSLATGQAVVYHSAGTGTSDGNLIDKQLYFVVVNPNDLTKTKIQLAATYADAMASNPVVLDLSTLTGSGHSLTAIASLSVYGTSGDDTFLLRASNKAFNAANYQNGGVAFVAALHGSPATAVERTNYNKNLEDLVVNTGDGNDSVTLDDNWAPTTIRGGNGNDTFQVGQVFQSARDAANANLAPDDEFATTLTTRGFLSNGVSYETSIYGGVGNHTDLFTVFRNVSPLHMFGGEGNNTFTIRAFVQDGSVHSSVFGGTGTNLIQYVLDADVDVTGGLGTNTLKIIGTEFDDQVVITKDGIFGIGVHVNYKKIQVLEIDAGEGDDTFYVLSTDPTMQTKLDGGLGSDKFVIGGDVPEIDGLDAQGNKVVLFPATVGPHSLAGIDNLTLDGAGGAGNAGLLIPLLLPGETNVLPSEGSVLAYAGTGQPGPSDMMTIDGSNLAGAGITNPLVDHIGNPLVDLIGHVLEISLGLGVGRFWLITAVAQVGTTTNYQLTLQNPAQPAPEWGLPDLLTHTAANATSKFAITHLSHSFFVDPAATVDSATIYNNAATGNQTANLTSSTITGLGMNHGINYLNLTTGSQYSGPALNNLTILLGNGN
ncbi:MAG TPA: hypothetical protein VGY66_36260, partial [Gemmataceae bacterium]|nr:hypothetical protein [Gemmataceae bacterium]